MLSLKKVSKLGFGTWGLSGDAYGYISIKDSKNLLDYSFKKKINYYDTAPSYGLGRVEKILSKLLQKQRSNLFISTKVGLYKNKKKIALKKKDLFNFRKNFIKKQFLESLKRLRTSYVDILFLHSPNKQNCKNIKELSNYMSELKKRGLIRYSGISPKTPEDGLYFLKKAYFDFIQINFNLTDQRIFDNKLYQLCKEKKTKLIVRTPLNLGFLAKKYAICKIKKNIKADHRSRWDIKQLKLWNKSHEIFKKIINKKKIPMAVFAIQYCMSFKNIFAVIPGMMTKQQVKQNSIVLNLKPMKSKLLKQIRYIYKKNVFFVR